MKSIPTEFEIMIPRDIEKQLEALVEKQLERYRPWTVQEEYILNTYYPILGAKPLVKFLPDRTLKSIRTKAASMNIKRGDVRAYANTKTRKGRE